MLPVLFHVGPLTIYSYGLMAATGFIVATMLLTRRAEVEGEDPEIAMDLAFYIVVSALIGARILYVIIEYKSYIYHPLKVFMIWEGGLVFFGGFVGSVIAGYWFVKKHNMRFWKMADIIAPSLAIGHAFGRIGCLGAGCCYGAVTDSGFGITFTDPASLAPLNVPLYPTQIYSSLNELMIFFILISIRNYKKFDGQIIALWMLIYPVGRFIIEFYRGDPRGSIGPLSTSQFIAIGIVLVGASIYYRLSPVANKNKSERQTAS